MKTSVPISVLLLACALTACSKPNAAASNQASAAPAAAPATAPATTAAAPMTPMPAAAPTSPFVGTWAFVGAIRGRGLTFQSAPICTFVQAAAGLEASCKGPSSAGTATAQVNGMAIDVIYQHHAIAADGVNGVTEFQGILGPDGVIRGRQRVSNIPGAVGPFTAQRVGN